MTTASARPWVVLALAVLVGACRGRPAPPPIVDWQVRSGAGAESAALLVLDQGGRGQLLCLPGSAPARPLPPGVVLRRILDAAWRGGPLLAGWATTRDAADPGVGGELFLLVPHQASRRLAVGVRTAYFSPDASALAYEVAPDHATGPAPGTSYVLELTTGKLTELAGLADPRWEADGQHLRATRWRDGGAEETKPSPQRTSLRARWDRASGAITLDGPGAAQLPAPLGAAVAFTEAPRSAVAPDHCTVLLSPRGGVPHTTVGRFCMGIADERGVRWSPDGRWLAFPHPGHVPGRAEPGFFVDVVSVAGGRSPALSALYAQARPAEPLALVTAPASVWLDWSPSGRYLALQDGASEVRVYDFAAPGVARLGKGQRPLWSPGGAYLLLLAPEPAMSGPSPGTDGRSAAPQAYLLAGTAPSARRNLGAVLDARWLPALACER